MAANKSNPNSTNPAEFIAAVDHETRRSDAETLLEIMGRTTGYEPKMWGPTIVGFGRYHYVYESGREGDFLIVGFSPRKANLVIYLLPGYEDFTDQLARLGKHKIGKSCLYVNKLADIDQGVLEEMIAISVTTMQATYETFAD